MTELSDMDLIKELFRIRTEYRLREIDIAKVVGGTQSSVNRWMQAASNPAGSGSCSYAPLSCPKLRRRRRFSGRRRFA